ncbi:MAG: RNA-binding transcriptional accessory protein [Planctomycetaceae bacterium]|nr:RNA-binding transcriptional accessory protein [Planctomycetales bacterium]MCB9940353.1 RNA-binding transcriptional accessory protein [Planctomycetaceae bacterium]
MDGTFECFHLEQVTQQISATLSVAPAQVRSAIELLDAGNTLPFIARYRKEATKGLDELALRAIEDALAKARELAQRKTTILKTIHEQGLLTPELRRQIEDCPDKKTLEDIYLPYKPKRRTKATIARERGLQPLADLLLAQQPLNRSRSDIVRPYVSLENEVPDEASALQGACDIVAEVWSEEAATRSWLAEQAVGFGRVVSSVKRGKKEEGSKFEMYFEHGEPVKRIPSHRFLAMKRGEAEGVLRVGLELDDEFTLRKLKQRLAHNSRFEFHRDLLTTVEDCYKRLLHPAAESAILQELKEKADEEAISVFASNLRELLLAAPAGPKVTIGLDPGFRTGCKVAVVDSTGKFLANTTIYPTPPRNDIEGATKTLRELIAKYKVELIAIGNGTASRETDAFVSELLKADGLSVTKVMVSESGASIYSASELAAHEYPDLDLTVRGAISIAHRLQDPLAELVKLDPKSIGVGQYQHDVNQTLLKKSLDREVESCVNSVGVDLNMASASLLTHVAGIGPKLAAGIVEYRDGHGRFETRGQLTKVPKLGKKAFEQAAGFLRIREGKQPLDNSAVHPESYYVVEKMAAKLNATTKQLVGNAASVEKLSAADYVDDQVGLPTVQDILAELAKPGRDPRSEFKVAKFTEGVNDLKDLKEGMVLEGVITNVTRFGAFVDLGVHQDGLIHISQLSNTFVQDPSEVVAVGDVVKVKVLEVDLDRKRIAVSRKQVAN